MGDVVVVFLTCTCFNQFDGNIPIDEGDFFCRGLGELSDAGAFRIGIMNARYLLKASGFPIRHDRFRVIFETSLFGNPLNFGWAHVGPWSRCCGQRPIFQPV